MNLPNEKIFQQIPKVMTDLEAIGKNRTNEAQKFKFRGIDDVYNELHPILAKHGVFTVPEVLESIREEKTTRNGGVLTSTVAKIKFTFYADDGSNFSAVVLGEGSDSGDKSSNKSMSVAHKYAFLQVFAIPTEEQKDPDFDSYELAPKEKPPIQLDRPLMTNEKKPPATDRDTEDKGYKINFGQWNGKSLEEVAQQFGMEQLSNYIVYLEEKAKKDQKPLTGKVLDFVNRATEFIGRFENTSINKIHQDGDPFL